MTAKRQDLRRVSVAQRIQTGGRSRRMCRQDKGMLQPAARPRVDHVLERLGPQVEEVVIVANWNTDRYARQGNRVRPGVAAP